ncbi:MAG: DUF975 domain-containing protein [Oscillatoria sp. PMC 1068.18]|nr:DUF975 domain-containing protein [Oscillatoria sp. PMC 1076.18]MEC4989062.1 DUF975 domain-containing protein [Oscillatoria sp. PMC 1068.18]
MSNLSSPNPPTGPLSVGNIVSAGLRIYRDRFKTYYGLAFKAYLWLLVPIYGWAKFAAISGQISRLAYNEVREQPETVKDAEHHVMRKMWGFFLAGILTSLIIFGIFCLGFIILGIIFGVAIAAIGGINSQPSVSSIIIVSVISIVVILLFFLGYIWVYSRFSIVELPIAVEENISATSAIGRSWNLTKGFVPRLVGVFTVAFLITLPISIVIQIATTILQLALTPLVDPNSPNPNSGLFLFLFYLIFVLITFVSGALLIPFWQTVKAVLYYDLRTRKEGLGLQMPERGSF